MRTVDVLCCIVSVVAVACAGCAWLRSGDERGATLRRREVLEERSRLTPLDNDEPIHAATPELEEEPTSTESTSSATTPPPSGNIGLTETARGEGASHGSLAPISSEHGPVAVAPIDESVAPLLGPNTPPHVAAALRCVEQGRILLFQGRAEAAREWFERALTLDGNNFYAYYFLARTALHSGRLDQAEGFLTRASTLSNQASSIWRSRVLSLHGEVLEGVGRFPEARQAYRDAAMLDPNNTQARSGLARLNEAQ